MIVRRFLPTVVAALAATAFAQSSPPTAEKLIVLKRADLMARKPEAGTSTVKVWTIRRTANSRANLVEFSGRSPMHIHPDAEHTLMVIEGSVTVKAGDEQIRLDVGDYVSIPPHMPHAYWVEPGGRALLVSFDAPAYDDTKTIFLEPRR